MRQRLDDPILEGAVTWRGTASSRVGFFGATPGAQPASVSQAVVATTAATNGGSPFGYTTSTQADGIVRLVNQLRSDLVTLGIIKGSA
jgi:UDP-N-acetyl-D-mannosaminuronic acid transferase (WecB/TagA/CpsF family)